jgi:flagellar protein FlgJ
MAINGINNNLIEFTLSNAQKNSAAKKVEDYNKKGLDNADKKELMDACKHFEGVFLNMLLKQMRNTVQKTEISEAVSGREMYESMLDETIIDTVSKRGDLGIAKAMYKQLSSEKNTK